MYIGHKIKMIREQRNLKQEFIANELGISQKQYSLIESNQTKLTVSRLIQIAKIINIEPEELLKNDTFVQNNYNNPINKAAQNYYENNELIIELKQEIAFLKEQISIKDDQISMLLNNT